MIQPQEKDVLSITALANRAKELLEGQFPSVWVSGEVSNLTRAASGHMYLTLKDQNAQIKSAFFRGNNLRLRFDPRDGMQVFARGQLSFYSPKGDCQFYILEMQPKGIGAAELALRQLKERLHAKGYFDPRRKRPTPRFPRRVALVASPTGAAVRDMIELLVQRWPSAEVIVRPSRVQGEGAAADIALSIRMLNELHRSQQLPLDLIIIGRGGGSSEDLNAFNEEIVADAIFRSTVPIISAVGHEIDVTVADLVADLRAETPSAAIMISTPDQLELKQKLLEQRRRLNDAIQRRIDLSRTRLRELESRPAFQKPLGRIHDWEQKLDETAARLQREIQRKVERSKERLASLGEQLQSLSPLNVLQRGYSLTYMADGEQVIRDARSLEIGDRIVSRLANGQVESQVLAISPTK